MLLTISAARRSASSPPMARLRLATRSFRNALIEAAAVEQFFDAIPDPADRYKIASGNAKTLFRLD